MNTQANKCIKPPMQPWREPEASLMQENLWVRPQTHEAARKSAAPGLVKIFKVGCWVNLSLIRAYFAVLFHLSKVAKSILWKGS